MRLNELEAKGKLRDRVVNFASDVSRELIGRTTMYAVSRNNKSWTRGDGSRYKEMATITPYHTAEQYSDKQSNEDMKLLPDHIQDRTDALDYLWSKIQANGKDIGSMSDEFSSMPGGSAILWNGIIFVKRRDTIEFGTKGRLKNADVWNTK